MLTNKYRVYNLYCWLQQNTKNETLSWLRMSCWSSFHNKMYEISYIHIQNQIDILDLCVYSAFPSVHMTCHSPGSNYEIPFAFRKVGYACYGNMLGWSNVQKYLNFLMMTFSPIWGPSESLNPLLEIKKKNVFIQYLEAKIVKIIYPWSVLKKTTRGSTFLIPIWGPRLSGSPESAIFDVIFWKSMAFHIKIASRGPPNRRPKYDSSKVQHLSFHRENKIMCVAILVNFLANQVWR